MNADVRRKVLAGCLCDASEAEVAVNELSKAERVVEDRAKLEKRRQAALSYYKMEVEDVDKLLGELQSRCSHPATTYSHGMPGEQYTTCDLCGANV